MRFLKINNSFINIEDINGIMSVTESDDPDSKFSKTENGSCRLLLNGGDRFVCRNIPSMRVIEVMGDLKKLTANPFESLFYADINEEDLTVKFFDSEHTELLTT